MRDRSMGDLVKDQQPLAMPPETTLAEACAAMHARRVGAVLVVEEGDRLVGIFTGRDALRSLAEAHDAKATTLSQVMTRDPTTLHPRHGAMEALRLLDDAGFRHLPICEEGRVRGIVSRYDFRAREHARLDEESGYFERMR
jgi:CBS domain-containing protein